MRAWLGGLLGACVLFGACIPDINCEHRACEPGEVQDCTCTVGLFEVQSLDGVRNCEADGGWGRCVCDDPGSTSTRTTWTGTSTGTGTGAGTGGGGGNPCTGQVDTGLGETQECQDCIAENCCTQYQTCSDSGGSDCGALFDCGDPNDGSCGTQCFYPVCSTPVGHVFWRTCVDCLSANCCTEYENCWADWDCSTCLVSDFQASTACDATTLDEDVLSCDSGSCCVECHAGGCGGAGGQGGHGGAAAGGSGGSGGAGGQGG